MILSFIDPHHPSINVSGNLLETVQPSFEPFYECLSNEAKAHGDNLTWQGPEDFRTAQNTAGPHSLHALFSLVIVMILLMVLVSFLSVMHGTEMIIPGHPLFFP